MIHSESSVPPSTSLSLTIVNHTFKQLESDIVTPINCGSKGSQALSEIFGLIINHHYTKRTILQNTVVLCPNHEDLLMRIYHMFVVYRMGEKTKPCQ